MADAPSIPANRIVNFGDAFRLGFKNYFQFQGRSSRGAYWYWALAMIALSIAASILDHAFFGDFVRAHKGSGPIDMLASLATLIPSIAVGVRRLHDIGRSGWWLLIVFTIIGIPLIIWWAAQPGERRDNRFGPDSETGR